jgi:pimeloyl-ACP methyl ester carboxylesterase
LLGLSDVKVHVEDSGGDGRPLVLIHGWPLSGKSWRKQVPALRAAGYRVITYDRRGFGMSDKPATGYGYDTLADDLEGLFEKLDLYDATVVGFSMGGGEVARYIARHGESRLRSVVFASSVTPMMMKTPGNPEGPLEPAKAAKMTAGLTVNADKFYDQFIREFFSANAEGEILVTESERQEAFELCKQASKLAALETLQSFGISDFRGDLAQVTVPTLVIHGDADGTVPFPGSGRRTHAAIPHSGLHVIQGGPHGINVSHPEEFNAVLLDFVERN